MEQRVLDQTLAQVRAYLESDDLAGAITLIATLRPPDQADVFEELHLGQQEMLLPRLGVEDAADILEELEDEDAAELASRLDLETLAPILDEMASDEAADLLGDLLPAQVTGALAQMADAGGVQALLVFPDDSAGGLMTTEFLALRRHMTATAALAAVREWAPEAEAGYFLFVVDGEGRLCGVVSLLDLIKAPPAARLSEVMDADVIYIRADADQEECAQLMAHYDAMTLPVVDESHRLLGVITVDDLVDVLEDEATEDIQRMGGTLPLDRRYLDTSVLQVAWKRVGWLLLLFVTGTLTANVMRYFEPLLTAEVALAFFVPLLIGTGGNAGSQTTATIIRALAVGDVDWRDVLKVFWHESRTGILLGLAMSAVGFIRALTWGTTVPMALAVSSGLLAIVLWANAVGALLPLIAARLKIDPTVISGPLMSTLVDATGLFIYLAIARAILRI
ncbi:MAG: magnesium transporter [Chloroflexi bacterium]|nr:magnesium transporter [Chloroflexota bacterium]